MAADRTVYVLGTAILALLSITHLTSALTDSNSLCADSQITCLHIDNCQLFNTKLSRLVSNYAVHVDGSAFDLMDNSDVNNLTDFYRAMLKYYNTLGGFNESFHQIEAENADSSISLQDRDRKYKTRLTYLMQDVDQTVKKLRSLLGDELTDTPTTANPATSTVDLGKNLSEIYSETAYVTEKFSSLLQKYITTCACSGARRRRRSRKYKKCRKNSLKGRKCRQLRKRGGRKQRRINRINKKL